MTVRIKNAGSVLTNTECRSALVYIPVVSHIFIYIALGADRSAYVYSNKSTMLLHIHAMHPSSIQCIRGPLRGTRHPIQCIRGPFQRKGRRICEKVTRKASDMRTNNQKYFGYAKRYSGHPPVIQFSASMHPWNVKSQNVQPFNASMYL